MWLAKFSASSRVSCLFQSSVDDATHLIWKCVPAGIRLSGVNALLSNAQRGPGLCHGAYHIQHFPAANAELRKALKLSLLRIAPRYCGSPSDCQPEVLPQVIVHHRVTEHCPRSVRCRMQAKTPNQQAFCMWSVKLRDSTREVHMHEEVEQQKCNTAP